MLLLRRPEKPAGFEERMAPHRLRVEASIRAGDRPDFEPPAWQTYKGPFASAQHGKCAYCEALVLATGVGDVEHFRPKAEISELGEDPATWGRERPELANVEGRQTRKISDRAYWWLAYSWDNWLLACDRCNRPWKGTLFPVAESPRRLPPAPDVEETPLVVDPFGSENPRAHLRFDSLGQAESVAGSRRGFETIRTLGLDRERLRDSRAEKASRIHALVRRLKTVEGERLTETLGDILEMGRSVYPHAGMVRIVFEQETGLEWSILGEEEAPE